VVCLEWSHSFWDTYLTVLAIPEEFVAKIERKEVLVLSPPPVKADWGVSAVLAAAWSIWWSGHCQGIEFSW
jgi:hypothetical protein